jgi:hypothetical protein
MIHGSSKTKKVEDLSRSMDRILAQWATFHRVVRDLVVRIHSIAAYFVPE